MKAPEDGTDAFYEGFDLEDNPFPEFDGRFEEWDRDFLDTANSYTERLKSNGASLKRRNENG